MPRCYNEAAIRDAVRGAKPGVLIRVYGTQSEEDKIRELCEKYNFDPEIAEKWIENGLGDSQAFLTSLMDIVTSVAK